MDKPESDLCFPVEKATTDLVNEHSSFPQYLYFCFGVWNVKVIVRDGGRGKRGWKKEEKRGEGESERGTQTREG